MRVLAIYALLALCSTAKCFDSLTYPIEGKIQLQDRAPATNLKVSLNGGEHLTYTKLDGSFIFHDVLPGIYLLDVHSTSHYFSQVKVNLPVNPADRVRCIEYQYPGASKQPLPHPIALTAHALQHHFEKRQSFGLHTIYKNPMFFMVLMSLFMVVVFPRMLKGMDPEALKEMQDQMEQSQDLGKMWGSLFEPDKPSPPNSGNKEVKDKKR
eukprot:CAMPEP_0113937182 /NCGR_PEP_ID=MMETSP1339-20121228/3863_1 /TAXON_ID=94617 /ORGANISM="Fibrocapsa japonica" /LENGTH=209 /DNA_ID=CAMNT_0000939857 /DNA_START=34 /DNA_END=663 /DNA_ORIENTATION=+ /assembly_acc=CAM_ASM_000762